MGTVTKINQGDIVYKSKSGSSVTKLPINPSIPTVTPRAPSTIATPAANTRTLAVVGAELEAAKKKEKSAIAAANNYVSNYMGAMDLQDPAELEALNKAAADATAAREKLEREYNSLPGSYDAKYGHIGDAGKAFATVLSKPFLAVDVVADTAKAAAKGETVDTNSLAHQKYNDLNLMREDALSETSGFGRTLAGTGLSIADNLYARALTLGSRIGGGLSMGITSAADKMHELNNKGEDAGRSLIRGAISGGIEGATEALPIGTLADLIKTGGKGVVKNLLKQGGVEATEEGISYFANYIADKAFKDPDAKWDWNEFKESVLSGGLSGLFFGLGGTFIGKAKSRANANPEISPTTPTNDATPTTTPSEQKTAPNAVNGTRAIKASSSVFDAGVLSDLNKARSNFVEYAKKHFPSLVTNKQTGRQIGISRNGIDKFLSGRIGKEKYASGFHIPELIENAVRIDDANNYHAEQADSIPTYEYYDSPIEIDGAQYTAHIRVRNTLMGDKYYGHTISEVDNIELEPSARASAPETPAVQSVNAIDDSNSATTVSQSEPVVNSGDTESVGAASSVFGQNTVGSAQARFKYQEAPTQSVADNLFTEQELQDYNLQNKHQVYTDAQANALADQLLTQDYEGEVSRLRDPDAVWDKTANVEGHRVLEGLIAKARKSKSEADWDAVREWKALYDRQGGTELGQALQGRAQFATSTAEIVAEAAETLEGPNIRKLKPQKKAQLLDEVYNQAEAYNEIESGNLDSLISLIERNSEIRRTTGLFSKKTAKQMDWALHQVAEKYPDTAEQFLRNVAVAQIRNIASDYNKVGVTEAAKSVRIMNMLSKVSTIMRNLVSNNIFDPLEAISGDVGVIADLIMSKMTGQRTTTIDRSWTSKAKRAGTLEGALKSYIEVGLDAPAQDATSRYEGTGSGRTFKMTGNIVERFLSTWSKYENYALQTTDEAQKGGIRAEAQRQIDSLKASGKLDSDALNEWANETARQRTFQNDSALSKTLTGLRDAANHLHVGSIGAGDILLPFAKVPANLATQSANYSPLGLLNDMRQVVEVMIDAKRGTVDAAKQAQVARNFGRGVTGTALLAGFAALAAKGLIDVAGADDEDKEALEKAQGKTGTQWNLSATLRALNGGSTEWKDDDLLMSIGFLDPLNSIMAAGSLLADDLEETEYQVGDVTKASLGGVWQAVLDLPAMSSVSDLINSYKYAEGETDAEKLINASLDYAGSQAASFVVPNALRGVATGLDDTVRNQYASESVGEATLDSFKSGIPGLRETLPASLDPFGREKTQTGNTLLNFLNNNVLPGSFTKYSETSVEKVLENLYGVTGEAGIYPDRKAPNSFSVKNKKITLDADDKDQFVKVAGSTAENLMSELVNSKEFKSSSANEQAAYLSLANEYARAIAKREITNGRYKLSGFAKSAEEAKEIGIDVSDYLMYYSGKSEYDSDKNGSYTTAENLKAIEESGFTGDALTALYMITFPSWVEGAAKRGVDFERYLSYKIATNGATKKADKIASLVDAGYTVVEANRMYKEME